MSSNIIKKGTADEVRCSVTELRLSETFMDVPQLSVKVVSSTPIAFEIGDYITYDYNGVTYTLRNIPEAAKNARPSTYGEAFVYNLVFYSPMWDLRNAPFLDLVLYDNGQHFTSMPDVTTYEDVYGIAARVQANMDNMYPGKWEIRVVSGLSADSTLAQRLSETQDFSLSDGKCLDALSQIYSQWGVSFVYSYESGKHVITIGGAETQEDTTGLFMYGRGNGLKVIKSSVQNASEIATRYYVYGGTQNMQPRYYNGRTMEPEYIHASDASNSTITGICSGRRLLGDNMYVPNLMIPVPKWGKSVWYVWTASSHSQAVFTEVRNPSIGDDYAFSEPNIGASRNVISSAASDSIVVNGLTYQYLTEVLYPDIRKAYIDAPQSYLDKYGIRPATLRFDGSGEREDIHPSIKGLTIGDIRAGLGSGAEHYPSTSVYTDPDERVDRVLSCDNPQDDGLTSSGANKYESSSSIAVAAIEKEFELALSNRAGNKIYTLGGRGSYYVLSEGAQFQVQYGGVLNARIPIQFSLATEGRDDRIHCRAGVKVNKTTSSGVKSVIGSSVDEKAVVDLSTIDMDLGVDISGVSVQSGDTISVDIELYTLTTELHDKVTVNIEAFTARYSIAISLGTDFYIKLKQIGFDISEVPTNDGESPVISMTSGQCGGYEFEIHDVSYNASDDSWTLRCARVQDGTLGQWFPNSIFGIEPDDTFVLLNIALPEVYITASEQRLYDAALAERLCEERPLLEPEIDSKVMAESPQVLRAGMWFSVKDTDLGLAGADGGSYLILIDSVEVTDKPDTIRSFKVTLRNNKEDNVFVRMQRQIAQTSASVQSERRSQTMTSVSEVPTKSGGGGEYIDTSDFVTLSTEQTITAPKTFAGDATFGAAKEDGSYSRLLIPSSSGPGMYDILISNAPVSGEAPSGSGGIDETELWAILGNTGTQQIGANHLTTALASYATKSWVENKGYLTSVDVSDIGGLGEGWAALLGSAPDFYTKSQVYSKSEADNRFVTLATEQIISGKKSFTALLTASAGISSTDADFSGYVSASKLYVPSYSGNKVYDLYISNAPVSGEVPSGSGGIDEDELWSILSNGSGEEIIAANYLPSLSSLTGDLPWSRVTNKPGLVNSVAGLTGSVTKAALQNALSDSTHRFVTDTQIESWNDKCDADDVRQIKVNNAVNADNVPLGGVTGIGNGWDDLLGSDKPSTLAGYGITDAYTKDGMDNLLLGYVTLRSEQSITGKKTFTQLLTASAGISSTYANFSDYISAAKLYLPYSGNNKKYDILISTAPVSGEAPSGTSGIDEDELWTILSNGSGEKVISVSFLPALASLSGDLPWSRLDGVPSWIGSSKPSYSYTEITGLGDQLATYARKDGSNATGTWGISISGNAATLGGVSKGGLLTSVTSTSTTNLSVVVGGKTISVTDLYAAYADRLLSDVSLWGQSFNGSQDVSGDMSGVGDIDMDGDITGAVNADFSGYVASKKLYLPYSGGNKVYDLCISTEPVSGSAPEAVNGIDEDELWDILGTPGTLTGQKIDASHLPPISDIGGKLDWGRITNPPSTYAPSAHEHPLSEISNLGSGWSDVLDGKLGGRWGSLLNYEVPGWLEQENLPVNGYLPVFGDKQYWIATDSHTHDIDEIGGLGNGWSSALTAAKPSWLTSVPKATSSAYGGIKIGYPESGKNYPVELDSSGRAYVSVPWVNTTYSLSSFGITATAAEINKLDGVDTLLHSGNYTSHLDSRYVNVSGDTMTGPLTLNSDLNLSANSHIIFNRENFNYLSVPLNGTFAFAVGTTLNGANTVLGIDGGKVFPGYHNGTISLGSSSYRWSSVYSVAGNFSGAVTISSSSEAFIIYQISGSNKAASGYLTGTGAYLYSWPAGKYLHITDAGSLLFGGSTVWHSGNDGSGSGLDADLLDGYHESSFLRSRQANNADFNTFTTSGVYRLSYTTSNGASNGPAGNEWGNMLVLHGGGDTIAQLAFGYVSSDRPMFRQGNPSNVGGSGSWTQWFTLATTLDNVASATKLQTSRTLWGQSFNGTANVSGSLTGVTSITASGEISGDRFDGGYISNYNTDRTYWVGDATRGISSAKAGLLLYSYGATRNVYVYTNGLERMVVNGSGNVGIGTTSPAYKLDVAGTGYFSSTLTLGAGITGVSTITGDGFAIGTNNLKIYDSTSKANRITANWSDGVARIYAVNEAGTTYSDLCIGQTQTQASFLYYDASVARWGLGTKSPAYKLDVAGTLRATGRITAAGLTSSASITANAGITTTTLSASGAVTLSSTLTAAGLIKASAGVQIGSTSDYGWYISTGTRISAGVNVARGVNVGSLLVSSAWADYTKVPTNGIYCKGNMLIAGSYVTIGGSTLSEDYALNVMGDTWIEGLLETRGGIDTKGDLVVQNRLFIPSSEGYRKYYIRIE